MPTYFLDTCALKHRYVESQFTKRIRQLVSNHRWDCYIADLSVLEISSALSDVCRQNGWDVERFDRMESSFMEDLATGCLQVRITTQREVERARHLIRFAGVVKKKSLKSADALIAICCLDLALETKQRIIFYTHDRKLHSTLCGIDAFQAALELRYLV